MTLTDAPNSFDYTMFYWIALIAIVIGGILFFFSCFIHVKKGYVAIIERMEIYHGTYQQGFYLFAPFIYRRVGMYKIEPKELEFSICGTVISIKIKITDFKVYHYAHINFEDLVNQIKESSFDSIDEFIYNLQLELQKIGCTLIK